MLRFLHNSNATIFNFLFIGCGSCSTHRIIAFYFVSLRSLFATEANCDTLLHTCKSDGTWKIHSGNYLHINHTHLPIQVLHLFQFEGQNYSLGFLAIQNQRIIEYCWILSWNPWWVDEDECRNINVKSLV